MRVWQRRKRGKQTGDVTQLCAASCFRKYCVLEVPLLLYKYTRSRLDRVTFTNIIQSANMSPCHASQVFPVLHRSMRTKSQAMQQHGSRLLKSAVVSTFFLLPILLFHTPIRISHSPSIFIGFPAGASATALQPSPPPTTQQSLGNLTSSLLLGAH